MEEKCAPCGSAAKALSAEEATKRLAALPDWKLAQDGRRIEKRFKFRDFMGALDFVNRVSALAETEGHHPDICFGWGYCYVAFQTHKISGLSENDFKMANKVDAVLASPAVSAT